MLKETVARPQLPRRKEKEIERKTKTSKETMQMIQLEKEGMLVRRVKYLGDSLIQILTMTLFAQAMSSKVGTRICKIKDSNPITFRSHRATKAICLIEVKQAIQARIRRKFEIMI